MMHQQHQHQHQQQSQQQQKQLIRENYKPQASDRNLQHKQSVSNQEEEDDNRTDAWRETGASAPKSTIDWRRQEEKDKVCHLSSVTSTTTNQPKLDRLRQLDYSRFVSGGESSVADCRWQRAATCEQQVDSRSSELPGCAFKGQSVVCEPPKEGGGETMLDSTCCLQAQARNQDQDQNEREQARRRQRQSSDLVKTSSLERHWTQQGKLRVEATLLDVCHSNAGEASISTTTTTPAKSQQLADCQQELQNKNKFLLNNNKTQNINNQDTQISNINKKNNIDICDATNSYFVLREEQNSQQNLLTTVPTLENHHHQELTRHKEQSKSLGLLQSTNMASVSSSSSSSSSTNLMLNNNSREPVPTPRNIQPLNGELSIVTNQLVNPRLRDIVSGISSANSPTSILSDSTTLITDVAMNSSGLIPKLIERLSRKLIVMKEEQLRLTKEIDSNERLGEKLFQTLRVSLSQSEYDKVTLHANEIEKVTKLILSLKLRLKKVESELKEKTIKEPVKIEPNKTKNASQQVSPNHQQSYPSQITSNQIVRGVSDPTSTIGLPSKRNHQHHASLQLHSESCSNQETINNINLNSCTNEPNKPLSLSNTQSGSSGLFSQSCSPRNSPELRIAEVEGEEKVEATETKESRNVVEASNSSDSIFNRTDSAIGSTIAGHGGSNINIQEQSTNISSQSSLNSAASSSSPLNHPNNHRKTHLPSNVSVSSHSSMSSSVPHSPPLMSPASTQGGIGTAGSSLSGLSTPVSINGTGNKQHLSPQYYSNRQLEQQNHHQNKAFHNNNNNNNNNNTNNQSIPEAVAVTNQVTTDNNVEDSLMIQPLTDFDILVAKRNKLVSQLEEAHQLEECILRRNNVIIQKILKKYYEDNNQSGEIAEFRHFTRLKSLLLKDTHDVADRIDNAELQLTELKQTST